MASSGAIKNRNEATIRSVSPCRGTTHPRFKSIPRVFRSSRHKTTSRDTHRRLRIDASCDCLSARASCRLRIGASCDHLNPSPRRGAILRSRGPIVILSSMGLGTPEGRLEIAERHNLGRASRPPSRDPGIPRRCRLSSDGCRGSQESHKYLRTRSTVPRHSRCLGTPHSRDASPCGLGTIDHLEIRKSS